MLYFVLFYAIMMAGTIFTLVGEALAVVLVVAGVVHLLRGRPAWYVRKGAKGAAIGGGLGALCAVAAFDAMPVFLLHLAAAGAGYVGLVPAKVYFPFRREAAGPPL